MKALLDGRFAPLTLSWGFLRRPLRDVEEQLIRWRASHNRQLEALHLEGVLETALSALEPLTVPRTRELLVSTESEWTAYFDNGANGGDPVAAVAPLSRFLSCEGLAVSCRPHTMRGGDREERGLYGAVQFQLFAPENCEFLNYQRTIAATNDGGKWVFVARGEVQPFERLDRYHAKRIVDRFTAETLEEYCRALGIDLFRESFYGPSYRLLVHLGQLPASHPSLTLTEAQGRLGLPR